MADTTQLDLTALTATPAVETTSIKKKRKKVKKKKPASGAEKYNRGEHNNTKNIRSSALRVKLKRSEDEAKQSEEQAFKAEILLPSQAGFLEAEDMEQTWRFTQAALKSHVDSRTAAKMFDLKLDQFGPYVMDFTRNGRHVALGGRKGHVATFEWTKLALTHEMHLRETLRDVKFLHDETLIATAQKKHVYIYDKDGVELHCLRTLNEVNCLDFLPYHFLLVAVGKSGCLQYVDTSTGQNVADHKTRLGEVKAMRQNPRNAVMHLGHSNGTVTLWSPNTGTPLAKMLCHKAPVLALALDIGGNAMVTSGLDGQVKVWDVRTYKELHSYFTVKPASTIDISDMGQLALGYGSHVAVWKDGLRTKAQSPYMREEFPGTTVKRVRFCPFEDALAVSHPRPSLVIPGVGEPNFDTFEIS
jgi:U3 small nucleolar RNA-associated protein 7